MSTAAPEPKRAMRYAIPALFFTAIGTVGVAFMPYFLSKAPLVLILLSPLFRHLVLVAPAVPFSELMLVAVPRHFAPDPFMYFLGRDYGPVAVQWLEVNSPATGKWVRMLERVFAKVGPVALLFYPDLIVSTLAGAAKVRFPVFVVMNLLGTIGTVIVAKWFGQTLEGPIRSMTVFFQSHLVEVTVASVVLFALFNWYSSRGEAAAEK